MGQNILLADPRFVFRQGLRNIFSSMFPGAFIEEVTTATAFATALAARPCDLTVVNQSFLLELAHIPEGVSIILASQPNKEILLAAYTRHVRAYLNDDPSEELLRFVLQLPAGDFRVDSAFSRWMIDQIAANGKYHVLREQLTKREQEVVELRTRGLSYRDIAEHLCIEVSTVQQHIVNVGRKQRKFTG